MADVELKPVSLHWLEGSDPFQDCCVHGGVYLKIGDIIVSDGKDLDWTVSAAAFPLLRSTLRDYNVSERRPLIPHCGHTMWPVDEEPDGLYLGGCDIGISWTIRHEGNQTIHEFYDGEKVIISVQDWRNVVCNFSDEVRRFFVTAWPKRIDDEFDEKGFQLFMKLWKQYRDEADAG